MNFLARTRMYACVYVHRHVARAQYRILFPSELKRHWAFLLLHCTSYESYKSFKRYIFYVPCTARVNMYAWNCTYQNLECILKNYLSECTCYRNFPSEKIYFPKMNGIKSRKVNADARFRNYLCAIRFANRLLLILHRKKNILN